MRLLKKGKSHTDSTCYLYNAEGIEYHEREDYAILRLPMMDVFIYNQEALDRLRAVLKKPEVEADDE